jgi:hypothetical protein
MLALGAYLTGNMRRKVRTMGGYVTTYATPEAG